MRKLTDPGAPAPPAPGSVGPPVRPPIPARSGSYALTSVDQDDVPTKPNGAVDPDMLKLVRLVDSMPPVERRRFVRLAESYVKCPLGRRVLLEELASELGSKE